MVDDTLIVRDDEGIEQFKLDYEKAGYDISFFGDVDKFLGIACKYDRKLGTLTLDRKEYIGEILHNFNMKDSRGVEGITQEYNGILPRIVWYYHPRLQSTTSYDSKEQHGSRNHCTMRLHRTNSMDTKYTTRFRQNNHPSD